LPPLAPHFFDLLFCTAHCIALLGVALGFLDDAIKYGLIDDKYVNFTWSNGSFYFRR